MIRALLIILVLFSKMVFSQTSRQGMKIFLKEKTKGDTEIRIKNTKVEIILNDTTKYNVTTDDQGMLDIETSAGKFSVTVKKDSCSTHTINGVIVGENKKAYITFNIECERYLNSLTKKELKNLGYKRVNTKKK